MLDTPCAAKMFRLLLGRGFRTCSSSQSTCKQVQSVGDVGVADRSSDTHDYRFAPPPRDSRQGIA